MHKLTPEHLYPSSKAKMRVYLAKQVLSKAVADFARHQDHDGELDALIDFLDIYNSTFKALNSTRKLYSIDDERIGTICKFVNWHLEWAAETGHQGNKHTETFISYQLFYDLRLLCIGFCGLVLTHLGDGVKYIVPKDINQDVVENFFGRIRRMSSGQSHPDMETAVRAARHLDDQRSRMKKEKRRVSSMDDEWYTMRGNCQGRFKVQRVLAPAPASMPTQKKGKYTRFKF